MKYVLILAASLLATSAMAQSCPPDYMKKNSYCEPTKRAKPSFEALPGKACPSNYRKYGKWCVKNTK